jgi:hypothetical protein
MVGWGSRVDSPRVSIPFIVSLLAILAQLVVSIFDRFHLLVVG